jgi:hypothetical protein
MWNQLVPLNRWNMGERLANHPCLPPLNKKRHCILFSLSLLSCSPSTKGSRAATGSGCGGPPGQQGWGGGDQGRPGDGDDQLGRAVTRGGEARRGGRNQQWGRWAVGDHQGRRAGGDHQGRRAGGDHQGQRAGSDHDGLQSRRLA